MTTVFITIGIIACIVTLVGMFAFLSILGEGMKH